MHSTDHTNKWDQTRSIEEVPQDAAYVQVYWGLRTAQRVVEEGAPSGALPNSIHLRQTQRSLIVFLSIKVQPHFAATAPAI